MLYDLSRTQFWMSEFSNLEAYTLTKVIEYFYIMKD